MVQILYKSFLLNLPQFQYNTKLQYLINQLNHAIYSEYQGFRS